MGVEVGWLVEGQVEKRDFIGVGFGKYFILGVYELGWWRLGVGIVSES